jgi:hypothetical protein
MKCRRNLLILVRLLGFAAIAEVLTISIFWHSTWTPLQRHYLPAYIWCSLPVVTPETVEVRLMWKTGRHRKRELATVGDADDSIDRAGMVLSQSAKDAGWKTLIEGPPQQVPAELLRVGLASLAFEGESLWDFLLLPELSAIVALCVSLVAWFLLVGFFRTLIGELAWRRQVSAFEEPSPSLFEECAALVRRVRSSLAKLHRRPPGRIEPHSLAPGTNTACGTPARSPRTFAFRLFGVHDLTRNGYLWSKTDQIE